MQLRAPAGGRRFTDHRVGVPEGDSVAQDQADKLSACAPSWMGGRGRLLGLPLALVAAVGLPPLPERTLSAASYITANDTVRALRPLQTLPYPCLLLGLAHCATPLRSRPIYNVM